MSGENYLTLKRIFLEKKIFEEYGFPTTGIVSAITCFDRQLQDTVCILLAKGIYIINGMKVMIS